MLQDSHWLRTKDGFALYDTPLADLLDSIGIHHTGLSQRNPSDVQSYYDDWHLYSVTGEETVYSLLKLREQEFDYIPGYSDKDDPGVTISFIPFDLSLLTALLPEQTRQQTLPAFVAGFRRVTDLPGQKHSPLLQKYFSDPGSDAPYLVAEVYLKKLLRYAGNGALPLPPQVDRAPRFVKERLLELNARAGRTICDLERRKLFIADPSAPTQEELYCLLVAHTGNPTFNSFAAEVEFHADALVSWENRLPVMGRVSWYASAIRADMQAGEGSGLANRLFSPYYDEHSRLVRRQAELHGKR